MRLRFLSLQLAHIVFVIIIVGSAALSSIAQTTPVDLAPRPS